MTLAVIVLGYLCGSIPWGLLFARAAGVDVRRTGSGNIGAANVARSAGTSLGLATLVADAAKGAIPVLVARAAAGPPWLPAAAGLAAFAGHVFPVTLGFAGGKGVATALGVLAPLAPTAAACAVTVFLAAFLATRYVSVGSLLGAVTAPVALAVLGAPAPVLGAGAAMAFVIVIRHRGNLARLRAGTEPRAGLLKRQASP